MQNSNKINVKTEAENKNENLVQIPVKEISLSERLLELTQLMDDPLEED
jgi:hypothetical protein